jgi:hypothetical protein
MMMRLIIAISSVVIATNAAAQTGFSKEEIGLVQQELSNHGYDAGEIEGEISWRTAVAIAQYQTDWQLPVTGVLDRELFGRLERKHPETKSRWQKVDNQNCEIWNELPRPQETVTWSGGCNSGKAKGMGHLKWSYFFLNDQSQETFEGDLVGGLAHGQGVITWSDGDRYEGDFVRNLFSGQGLFSWANGNRFEGSFKDDKFNGQGVFSFADGSRYEGGFKDDLFDGYGVFTTVKGLRYEGSFKSDKFHGRGVLSFANGNRYEGDFEDDHFHGQGLFIWANGNSHEGEYRNGQPNGYGVYFTDDVETMRGAWRNGCLSVDGSNRAVGTTLEACGYE